MSDGLFSLKTASYPLLVSAVLHLLAFVAIGFNAMAGVMFVIGLLYAAIAFGLQRGMRWLGYLTFIFMLIGAIASYANTGGPSGLSNFWYSAILLADLVTAVILFIVLWRPRNVTA